MDKTLLKILGFDLDQIPPGAEWEFVWTGQYMLESWRIFAFIGGVVLFVWLCFFMYRRELRTASMPVKMGLGVVRALVLVVLALVLLGPAIKISEKKVRQDVILVLLDDSLSMLTRDQYLDPDARARVARLTGMTEEQVRAGEPDRAALVNGILKHQGGQFLRDLTKQGNVKVRTFSARAKPQSFAFTGDDGQPGDAADTGGADGENTGGADGATDTGAASAADAADADGESTAGPDYAVNLQPESQSTNLERAIRDAIDESPGAPIAGIIIITDGQNTVPAANPRDAADYAAEKNVPIFALGVGDPSKARNLRVLQASANERARKNNPFQVEGQIEAAGINDLIEAAGQSDRLEVTVQLVALQMPGGGEGENVIDTKIVNLPATAAESDDASAVAPVNFEYTAQNPGDYKLALRVVAVQGVEESNTRDNLSDAIDVTVRSDKARVLLVSGGPTWEYRSLMPLLLRDPDVDLSVWLQSLEPDMRQEGNTVIEHLPVTDAELFEYDAILLLDPDPIEMNDIWIDRLMRFAAQEGGGVLFMPGPKYATQLLGGNLTRSFQTLLPVEFPELGRLDVIDTIGQYSRPWTLAIVDANRDHPIMKFDPANPQLNEAVWAAIADIGIYWSFPAVRGKPTARVLVEHSGPTAPFRTGDDRRPLIATSRYGPGPVVYLGFNGTWRWRRVGADSKFYEKFWLQIVKSFLISGRDQRGKRGFVELPGRKFDVGKSIEVTAQFKDASFQPLKDAEIEAMLKTPSGIQPVIFKKADDDEQGRYKAIVVPQEIGEYEVNVQFDDGPAGGKPEPIVQRFTVTLPDVEIRQTRLNKQLLTDMAEVSEGEYFEIDEWTAIATTLPDRRQELIVARKPLELWSTERLLILLVVLLTIEWAVRKRHKLM